MYKAGTGTVTLPRLGIFSIANQLRVGVVSVLILALLVMAGSLIYLSFQTQQRQLSTIQEERAKDGAAQINAYMDDLQRKLGYLARVRGLTEMPLEIQANLLEGLARHNTAYETLTILDSAGQTVQEVSSYGSPVAPDLNDSLAFSRAFNLKQDFVSAVEVDRVTNLPYVTLAVPIRDQDDEVDGVLSATVNLKFLSFITSRVRVGESGYAYVVDNRGFLIAQQGSLPESFPLEEISAGFIGHSLHLNNAQRGDTYQGLKGVEVVGASAPVRTSRWNVVVELPTAEAYAPTRTMLRVMGIVLAVAAVVSIGLAILLSHSISSRLIKLRNTALRVGRGELDTEIDIRSNDEIGDLGLAFSKMTQDLQQTTVSKDYVDNIIRSMADTLIVINPDGTIRTVNWAAEETLGYGEDELIGKPAALVFAQEEGGEEGAFSGTKLQTLATKGPVRDLIINLRTKSGVTIPVSFSGSAMRDSTGTLTAVVGIARDMREMNRLQAQLVQAGKMSGLGQLGAGIAHELNQPITSIQGFAQIIRRDGAGKASFETDIIIRETRRMALIVNNIRDFARQGDFKAKPTEPTEPLDDALMLLTEQLRLHGVEVNKKAEEALPRVLADKIRLQQVFLNMISNALDALNELPNGKEKTLILAVKSDGNHVVYSIEDSGVGVPEAIESQIFDPFFTTKPLGKGMGLGLSLSYGIVADHGGEITYQRASSGGALFTVRIPVASIDTSGGAERFVVPGERRGGNGHFS